MVYRCALVVDDAPAARLRAVTLLRLAGWRVRESSTAIGALATAARYFPQLVLTEAQLPDSDGVDLLHELRAEGSRARSLVVTSHVTSGLQARAAAAGAACLAKPLEPADLIEFLSGRTTGPTAQPAPRGPVPDWVLQQQVLQVPSARADRQVPGAPVAAAQLRRRYERPLERRFWSTDGDRPRGLAAHDRWA